MTKTRSNPRDKKMFQRENSKLTGVVSLGSEIFLRIVGCWPCSSALLVLFCKIFWTITTGLIEIFQLWYLIAHMKTDPLNLLMDSVSVFVVYGLTLIKLIALWINRRTFYNLLFEMERDWRECSKDSSMCTMTRTRIRSHRLSNVIIVCTGLTVVFYGIGGLASNDAGTQESSRELLYKMELPFESSVSPIYELIWALQFVHQMTSASIVGMLNGVILTMILHVGGQIDIVCHSLREISLKDNEDDLTVRMNSLIDKHQRIIAFAENIEAIFSYVALLQFLSNTLIMCALGYQLVTSIGTDDWIATTTKAVMFYVVVSIEAFIFCFAGEYLGVKSTAIADAAYESLWYNLTPNQSRVLLLLIVRSQKQLTLTTGKFMDLSMERFTTIMKASASYVSVLYAMT